ncbi:MULTISPECIES: aspartate ammonia-lyase [Peptoniphilus]|uniref:aspartate ammonia-lyase n=1 Tax=Peptoniphilus TaxID=162289 RepID=UPI0001DA9D4C|nr:MULTISPECIES: aspartate ammonia-lyase [Peptoniphilus]EFI42304.1 putative aspartate ammonia-lyase [Peptoniphilus sp. oral taxon 386 str. F0131]
MNEYRLEHDSVGEKKIPSEAYYGVHSLRACENFAITGHKLHDELINSISEIKKACAITNMEVGILSKDIGNAIVSACDEIISGNFHDQFIVDPIQGGAGTSTNMNANEVIANIALEKLNSIKGNYKLINPNDHVNMGQSTNDVYPSCGKLTTLKLISKTIDKLILLNSYFELKSKEFKDVIKMGRTQLEDAVPITLGQEFNAYSTAIKRDIERLKRVSNELRILNLGGTAIGTGLNADVNYVKNVVPNLNKITNLNLVQAEDLIDATQNLDCYVSVSGVIKSCAVNLSKISNDLRLMNSGPRAGIGEINLPARQNGSSIMPGKINPVIPEVVNQVAFNIIGNDMTITMAAEAGQLELNAFEPVIFFNLFESLETLSGAIITLAENCIKDITANKEECKHLVEHSIGMITAINPYVGYEKAAEIAKEALKTGQSIKELIIRDNLIPIDEIDDILNPFKMIKPGIISKDR